VEIWDSPTTDDVHGVEMISQAVAMRVRRGTTWGCLLRGTKARGGGARAVLCKPGASIRTQVEGRGLYG